MRALTLALLIPLIAACSTGMKSTSTSAPTPLAESPAIASDISGKWTGWWIGTGLFNSPRQEDLTLDLVQRGDAGYGRMVIDGAVAAESVPWEVRQQGLSGIRVFAAVDGSKVKIMHELDRRLFTADLTVEGDRMVGHVKGSSVRLILSRKSQPQTVAPQAAQATPPQVPVASAPVMPEPAAVALAPQPQESADQSQSAQPAQRPRQEDFVAAPELKAVFFDFDKAVLRPDAVDALTANTAWLKENAETLVLIEGNCDERGTAEYNLALGDRRAKSAMDYLEANGISKDRVSTISYGKERPVCTEATDECMTQNRRAEFKVKSR